MRLRNEQTVRLNPPTLFMDCRVKPGNDAASFVLE
jgi:hypothetical protein